MTGGAIGDMWIDYGHSRTVPRNAQMYVLTNEQINFIASLVVGTNDVFTFQIPYPFYVDQTEMAIVFHRIDFIYRQTAVNRVTASAHNRIQVDLQYSDKEPAADWNGDGEDVEDENIQAMFDGPFVIGENKYAMAPDTDALLAVQVALTSIINCHYYPPDAGGLDAFFPVTVVFTNMTHDRDLVDQIADAQNFTTFERVFLRIFFTTRRLSQAEKNLMNSEYYGLVPLS